MRVLLAAAALAALLSPASAQVKGGAWSDAAAVLRVSGKVGGLSVGKASNLSALVTALERSGVSPETITFAPTPAKAALAALEPARAFAAETAAKAAVWASDPETASPELVRERAESVELAYRLRTLLPDQASREKLRDSRNKIQALSQANAVLESWKKKGPAADLNGEEVPSVEAGSAGPNLRRSGLKAAISARGSGPHGVPSWSARPGWVRSWSWWVQPLIAYGTALTVHLRLEALGHLPRLGNPGVPLEQAALSAGLLGGAAGLVLLLPHLARGGRLRDAAPTALSIIASGAMIALALQLPIGIGPLSLPLLGAAALSVPLVFAYHRYKSVRAAPGVKASKVPSLLAGFGLLGVGGLAVKSMGLTAIAAASLLANFVFTSALLRSTGAAKETRSAREPSRRRFLKAAGTAALSAVAAGPAAGAALAGFAARLDERVRHIRPSANGGYSQQSVQAMISAEDSAVTNGKWSDFKEAVAALRATDSPAEAARLARRMSVISNALAAPSSDEIVSFVLEQETTRAPSFYARDLVVQAKQRLIGMIRTEADVKRLVASMKVHVERVPAADPSFPDFGTNESDYLTGRVRQAIALQMGAITGRFPSWFKWDSGRGTALEIWYRGQSPSYLLELDRLSREAREEREHVVPPSFSYAIADIRSWPKDVLAAVAETARAHHMPSELLAANLAAQVERQYSLWEGFDIFARRQDEKTASGRWKKKIADFLKPFAPQNISWPVSWNDFLGGVVLGGKSGMGLFQIRPANVRRYPTVWKRFGIADARKLSNRQISYLLVDTRYNVEAWAVILEGMLEDVEKLRAQAASAQAIDVSEYAKESQYWLQSLSADFYKALPPLSASRPDRWNAALFHPLLAAKAAADPGLAFAYLKSGALDGRPIRLTPLKTTSDVAFLNSWVSSPDPELREEALRALRAAAGSGDKDLAQLADAQVFAHASGGFAPAAPEPGMLPEWAPLGNAVLAAAGTAFVAAAAANPKLSRRRLLGLGDRR